MYLAGLHRRRLHRRRRLRRAPYLRGKRDRYHRIALVVPLTIAALAAPVQLVVGDWAGRDVAETRSRPSSPRSRGSGRRPKGAPIHVGGVMTRTARSTAGSRSRTALAARLARPERDGRGARRGAARRSAAGEHRAHRVPDDGRRSARCSRCSAAVYLITWLAQAATAPLDLVLPRCSCSPGRRRARGADRRLDHHRGRSPAVDRLRGDAHRGGGHRRPAGSRSATRRSSSSTSASPRSCWSAAPPRPHPPEIEVDGAAARPIGARRRRAA